LKCGQADVGAEPVKIPKEVDAAQGRATGFPARRNLTIDAVSRGRQILSGNDEDAHSERLRRLRF